MLFKKKSSKTPPSNAEIINGEAVWKGRDRKVHRAQVVNGKITVESKYWSARWVDGDGNTREESTGCTLRNAAEKWLTDRKRESELIKVGVVSRGEVEQGKAQGERLSDLVERYVAHLDLSGRAERYKTERGEQLTLVFKECGFTVLRDLDRSRFEAWLLKQRDTRSKRRPNGMGAARRNIYRSAMVQFSSWLVREAMMQTNPFVAVPVASERTDRRHVRRSFTEGELTLLFDAASRRPLHMAMHSNRGEDVADLDARTVRKLELLGRERVLIYKTLFLTGLRKGELRSVSLADTDLDAGVIHLRAANEKNRRGSDIPLRADLVAEITAHLKDRSAFEREEAVRAGTPAKAKTDHARPLFEVPTALDKILTRDLEFAGIAKTDPRGRVVDVHSLRVSLCSHMAKAGVSLRTAQEVMRHSDPKLTAMIYTDVSLLDTRGAIDALPTFGTGDSTKTASS